MGITYDSEPELPSSNPELDESESEQESNAPDIERLHARNSPEPRHPHLDKLRDALSADVLPCSTGAFGVKNEDLILYYGRENGDSRRIDFTNASEEDVSKLLESCDAATFGVNQQDVLDETYRKASKLDTAFFSAKFDPVHSGLMDVLRDVLMEGHGADKRIRVELYKLNVYGPGSFFKSHKDTPRGDNMFASLVIVYPTQHEGGSLVFRHGQQEFTFDSAAAVSCAATPSVAFATFYSDVEHEVTPVLSGHRVTLTYNLYLEDTPKPTITPYASAYESALKKAFSDLLDDDTFYPDGCHIGFGLRHEYPIDDNNTQSVEYLKTSLKGSDAVLMKVCTELSLDASIQIVYSAPYMGMVLCPKTLEKGSFLEGDTEYELAELGGKAVGAPKPDPWGYYHNDEEPLPYIDVLWATPARLESVKEVETAYAAYGNEPSIGFVYGTLCLIIDIGKAGERRKAE